MMKKLPRYSPLTYRKTRFEGEASILALIQFGLTCPWTARWRYPMDIWICDSMECIKLI